MPNYQKWNVLIIFIGIASLSACVSTYKPPKGEPTAKITVRSPQGQYVTAYKFDESKNCVTKQALKGQGANKAIKTYTIETAEEVAFAVHMLGIGFDSYSCRFTLKLPLIENDHYIVTVISDKGKNRCNNKIINTQDSDLAVNAKFIDNAPSSEPFTSSKPFCEGVTFNEITSKEGKFISTAYGKTAISTGNGGYYSSESKLKER